MKKYKLFRRVSALLLALILCITTAAPALAAEHEETIYIRTAEDLQELAQNCTLDIWSCGKTVVLQADISLSDTDFRQIPTFGGTFEGNGHTVSGLALTGITVPTGLFAVIQPGAVVRELKVSGSVDPSGAAIMVGGIAGENHGTIENCSFYGNVSGSASVGGIAGVNALTGTVKNCRTEGAVFGENMTGGIVGYNLGIVEACVNKAYVNIFSVDPAMDIEDINFSFLLDMSKITSLDTSTAAMDTGGIAGYSSGIIRSCENTSTIGYQHIGYNVGGIVGRSCGFIADCRNSAEIYGRKDVGGIAGQMEPYIALNLSKSTLATLQNQLDELNAMVDTAIADAEGSSAVVTNRLNKIADYTDSAADAASNITTTGSIQSNITGGAGTDNGGNITVTPPQIEVGGGIENGGNVNVEIAPPSAGGETGSYVEGEFYGGLTEGGVQGGLSAGMGGQADANTQIEVNTNLGGLTSSVNGLTGQIRLLSSEMQGATGALAADLQAINDQIDAISTTLTEAMQEPEQSDVVSDTSLVDVDSVTSGKAKACANTGTIYGDINVGGICGSMSVEYELDPEDDVSSEMSGDQRRSYELKAIIQSCVNEGTVTAKRSYVGGICGRMDLGLITAAESYGPTESENGDYVGGVAGITGGTIQNCYAKCTLRGGQYIGGIVGSGIAEASSGSASTVSGCRSMVSIPECKQYIGAVSGVDTGIFIENIFVSEALAGINGLSFSGRAEPVTYEVLTDGEVPEAFCVLSLDFVVDGTIVKSIPFQYGDTLSDTVYPELPVKEGHYACWDKTELTALKGDTVVTAVYTPYVSTLRSTDTRSEGKAVFLVEGQFDDSAKVSMEALSAPSAALEIFPDDVASFLEQCFTGSSVSRETVECWSLTIPGDGSYIRTVRYLPANGETDNLDVYTLREGGWERVETRAVGSYLTFPLNASDTEIAVVSTMPTWWVWVVAGVLVLLLLWLLIVIIRKLSRGKGKIVLVVLLILSIAAGGTAWFLLGDFSPTNDTDPDSLVSRPDHVLRLAAAWEELRGQEYFSADLELSADCGPVILSEDLRLYHWKEEDISAVGKNDALLYFTDSTVCDKNGNKVNAASTDTVGAAEILAFAYAFSSNIDSDYSGSQGDYTYTFVLDEDAMRVVVAAVAPDAASLDIQYGEGTLVIHVCDNEIKELSVSCTGTIQIVLTEAEVAVSANIRFDDIPEERTLPEEVRSSLGQERNNTQL